MFILGVFEHGDEKEDLPNIQTNGGPLNEQPHPYSWTRDIPYEIANAAVCMKIVVYITHKNINLNCKYIPQYNS